jgi:hypothetical protein
MPGNAARFVTSLRRGLSIMRRRRRWATVLGILALAAGVIGYMMWPGSSTFTVGSQTTYVTGPLDKHGYVDYVTALNEQLSKGITPKDNANILIWQAFGPRPEGGAALPPEYFRWLGTEPPGEAGAYLVRWRDYLQQHLRGGNELDDFGRLRRAGQWPWMAKDEPELADWLKRNEKPLALIRDATRRPEYYNPLVPERSEDWSPGLIQALLPSVQSCREVASALACRAMLRAAEGREKEAWQDLLACHRLGRLLARGGTLIELLVGFAISGVATKADLAFLDHVQLTSNQILVYLEDLRKLPPMPTVADKADLGERFVLLDTMRMAARHGAPFLQSLSESNGKLSEGQEITARLFTRSIN